MFWYVTVETEDGDYYCCVSASNEMSAAKKAMQHYRNDGEEVLSADAVMFNTYEHGDPNDYEVI